jgi:putative transposase
MAPSQSALSELLDALRAGEDLDVVREALALVLQALIDAEATQRIGARPYERTQQRTTHRNGSRSRLLSTKAGDVELQIPKLREGAFFPALLEPRRRIDRALLAVVMEAYVHGTSTRKVDDLVRALGVDAGISKSEVSRICSELDGEVAAFRSRSLAHTAFPYVFLDATYLKARVDGRVVSRAVVIATGVTADGGREVLGLDVGDSEDGAFWTAFPRSLKARGLAGVQLVVFDAHTGLKQAIDAVMAGAAWQRCRVHFLRNVLARVPRGSAEMVAAAIRTIFAQPTGAEVTEQVSKVAAMLQPKFPQVTTMLLDAREDLTAFADFPAAHWTKIWSTNPLERVNKEVKRRTNVVGIFPDDAAVLRLAGAVLIEAHDEWQVAERRYLSEGSMAKLAATGDDGPRPQGGEEDNCRAGQVVAVSSQLVAEVHDDALISTTPRDAARRNRTGDPILR